MSTSHKHLYLVWKAVEFVIAASIRFLIIAGVSRALEKSLVAFSFRLFAKLVVSGSMECHKFSYTLMSFHSSSGENSRSRGFCSIARMVFHGLSWVLKGIPRSETFSFAARHQPRNDQKIFNFTPFRTLPITHAHPQFHTLAIVQRGQAHPTNRFLQKSVASRMYITLRNRARTSASLHVRHIYTHTHTRTYEWKPTRLSQISTHAHIHAGSARRRHD